MIYKLLQSFQENNIKVWAEDGKIKFSAPKSKITNDFIAALKANKEMLLDYFANSNGIESKTIIATRNQMALWIERKLGSVDGTIHNGMIKVMHGNIEAANIRNAFINVIKRHEALKSTFYEEAGEVYITSGDINENFFSVEDLSFMGFDEACRYIKNKMNETLNLKDGPLFRVGVYTVEKDMHIIGLWAHHIISDGYSLFIIEKEFYRFYDEIVNGSRYQINNAGSYFDSIKEEQEYLASSQYMKDIEYWKQCLDENIKGSSLPKYKVKASGRYRYKAATFIHKYSKELSSAIQASARECQTTVYMLVFAMFNFAMRQYNEGRKTSLGLFSSNRLEEKHRSIVGYFANAVVFQFEADGEMTVLQYVQKVKTQIFQMLSRQQTPFTCLVSEMKPDREEGNLFFSVAFDSLLFPRDKETEQMREKLNITEYALVKGSGEYDLIVWISEQEGSYSLEYRYNSEVFEGYQINAFAETVEGMLGVVCSDNNMVLSQIPVLYGESKRIIEEINCTQTECKELSVCDVIRKQCFKNKEKTAISCGSGQISYEQTEALISYISKWMKQAGVQKGDYVGIMLERNCYLIPAILSVWSIGAVYVPIDPHFPVNRKEYIIRNTGLAAVLTEEMLKDSINTEVMSISIEDIAAEWTLQDKRRIENAEAFYAEAASDAPAYVLYTSGSTGQPKGVVISHSSFMNFLSDMVKNISLSEKDKVLAITSTCFDISLLEMILPLFAGAGVVMVTHEEALDGRKILECIKENEVTVMQATPSSFDMLYDFYEKENSSGLLLKSCLCGGEGYELDLVNKMQRMAGRVFNVYGPTETTIWSAIYEFPRTCSNVLIGKPIANTKVMVVNEVGLPLPVGAPGELLIGGKGVFKGYYNNEAMTEQAVIKLPDGDIYYKTGDWAYFNADGMLKFLGRKDSQVKLRGFRIELSEIENVFRKYEDIGKVAVITIQENGSDSLAAAVVPKDNAKLDSEVIMQHIEKYLPEYMLPSHIFVVGELPMTANRKIDKKAIRKMISELITNAFKTEAIEKESDLEKQIKAVWEEVLNKPVYSVNTGFFEAGGNSLLLNKLAAKFEMIFKRSIDIIQLLKYGTVRKMAAYICGDGTEHDKSSDDNAEYVNRRSQYLKSRKR